MKTWLKVIDGVIVSKGQKPMKTPRGTARRQRRDGIPPKHTPAREAWDAARLSTSQHLSKGE